MARKRHFFTVLLLALLSTGLGAQQDTAAVVDTVAQPVLSAVPDTVHALKPAKKAQSDQKKIKIVRRRFKYRDQIRPALAMMIFIGIVLTTTQSWNP